MAFVTESQLERDGGTRVEGVIKLAKSLEDESDLFLSHSHLDGLKVVARAAHVLTSHGGASVYVDRLDSKLGELDADKRPRRLRTAIKKCRKLVVLFTSTTASSKWIPWELGCGDGFHGWRNVATLPVSKTASEAPWGTQEYLGLYPQIRFMRLQGHERSQYCVRDPTDDLYWTLSEWVAEDR